MRLAWVVQRSDERELPVRRRLDGREVRMCPRDGSLTEVERASLSAATWEGLSCFLERKMTARDMERVGALVEGMDLYSRVESTRATASRNTILLCQ